ncbi:MAG TPA: VWA domain-containing protein [Blastocatellia bacterium]|nr:VWA domain-containing protein [Blastocatellia bacterium]
MKFIKSGITSAALIMSLSLCAFIPAGARENKQQPPPPKSEGQKQDKGQKPAPEEGPQEDEPIKLGAALVTVPFNVTDKQNRYINELGKSDVELLEDNKPQQIFSFERQTDLPITIAMLIDISGSQEFTLPSEVTAGKSFFTQVLRPKKDLAAVVTFENESVLVQNLTSDIEKLYRALDSVRISVQTPSVGPVGGTPPINPRGAGSTAMYDSIYSVSSDLLKHEAGRRVIILVTDGQDTSSQVKLREAIEVTWRNEIIVYAIGIGDQFYGVDSGVLKKVAAETGGRAFFPRSDSDLAKAYALIDEDLRSQYIASYGSSNEAKDGSFRTIQVKVKNRKELTVRHRRGYFASKR